ncbi:hypothetical protein CTEN210_14937 [Chaetoceros tenuissimus]|uniref:Uncharacterized protein n=1 Tax=Chaetoceros tenuissimus TaxID=426638 RepID=A0AAD3D862_9STRA|nr:hypothetical protein CTEN210_14937 [Chaetoceros tenuissimus]
MNISTFQNNLHFIKSLYFNEEWKDKKCRDEVLRVLEEANGKIEKAFGESICVLKDHKPSLEAVEKVANKFPSTLTYRNDRGRIPIQHAVISCNGYEYVPVLAEEGMKHEVGGEDARGGLLMVDPYKNWGLNTMQLLASVRSYDGEDDDDRRHSDVKRLNLLKELREMDLLLKRDIQEQHLLACSCWKLSQMRFEYLADWDKDALIETRIGNEEMIHVMSSQPQEIIGLLLKAGFKYHPNIGGLLFIEDDQGNTAFDHLVNEKGVEVVMSLLHEILSPNRDYPILHHVFVKAPQHKDLFMNKFPWAYSLKDHNGRTLHQAVLAAGPDVMIANDILLATLTDDQFQTQDPINNLYPFAAMAVGEHANLEKIFYLLRRQPSVMERHSRSSSWNSCASFQSEDEYQR